jgi:cobalt/nickel transport protein
VSLGQAIEVSVVRSPWKYLSRAALLAVWLSCCGAGVARAHFQVLLPSSDVVSAADNQTIVLDLLFTHPMEQTPVMEMARPRQFGVLLDGKKTDLRGDLQSRKVAGKTAYTCPVRLTTPGDYVFYLAPEPYWEAAEAKMIVHYTKVVVDALDAQQGWDALVGLPVEIEPLVRPYGLWTGNSFRGIVRHNGKPVPFAHVEVEYYNRGGRVKVPNEAFVTQVVKADAGGVFSYTMPRAGWWGFAALVPGEKMKNPAGKMVDVELGGLIWVRTVDMKEKD